MSHHTRPTAPDAWQRDRIVEELDRNLLVEASAGSGKTTAMVRRMVELLKLKRCSVANMAAVTFTRKAAGELRARFQVELERAKNKLQEEGSLIPSTLRDALNKIDQCFIGTIHAFCARLLRERPVEAGVGPDFREVDEYEEASLSDLAWEEFVGEQLSGDSSLVAKLAEVGLELTDLRDACRRFADYGDVEAWPAPATPPPDAARLRTLLRQYHERMTLLAEEFPRDAGNDRLMPLYRRLPRLAAVGDLHLLPALMNHLAYYKPLKPNAIVQRNWPGADTKAKAAKAKGELERWNQFVETSVLPAQVQWCAHRYPLVLEVLREAARHFQHVRERRGVLNFQDLLLRARNLLRDHVIVREHFRERLTHLLVDEFQDTDPLQAEVILYLTATDGRERDWRQCRPRPGSLFVVGDPQQSIYRFRRADLVTYERVKEIIEATGGETIGLTANFRSQPGIVAWVNQVFSQVFPTHTTPEAPAHRPMVAARSDLEHQEGSCLYQLTVPASHSNKDQAAYYEAQQAARIIQRALHEGFPWDGDSPAKPLRADDFLIVTWNRQRLSYFGMALEKLGIPYHSSGSATLNEMSEVRLLHQLLDALAHPEDPIAMLALLRGGLFGVSDPELYAYSQAGGAFDWTREVPAHLSDEARQQWENRLNLIRRCAAWWDCLPPVAAVLRMLESTGLLAWPGLAGVSPRSTISLEKLTALLHREAAAGAGKTALVQWLGALLEKREMHDSLSPPPRTEPCVRLMNLHKVKGLEAPVVFLADTNGAWEPPVDLHIDRSQPQSRGYLAVRGKSEGFGAAPLLAHPLDWETHETAERAFVEAERKRLLYVAATRAARYLFISQRTDDRLNDRNPWQLFRGYLEHAPGLPLLSEGLNLPSHAARTLHKADVQTSLAEIQQRRRRLQGGKPA